MAIHRFGLANLRSEFRAPEALGGDSIRLAIRAVSLNYRDVLLMRGIHGDGVPLPLVPCSDAAGVVLEVGAAVTGLEPGDRVCTHMVPDWHEGRLEPPMRLTTLGGPAQGVLCDERVLPQAALLPLPAGLAFEHAACLPVAGLAAWRALTTEAAVGPSSRVLLIGSGGVGTLGLQIAKKLGAEVAVVSSSEDKLSRLRDLGADYTICSRHADWGEMVRRWSDGGVDAVLATGGDGAFEQSVTATRDGGCIALLSAGGHGVEPGSLADVLTRRIRVQGVFVGSRADLERYLRFVEAHAIEPIIDRVFEGLSAARHAFAHLVTGRHVGKVVVRVSG